MATSNIFSGEQAPNLATWKEEAVAERLAEIDKSMANINALPDLIHIVFEQPDGGDGELIDREAA